MKCRDADNYAVVVRIQPFARSEGHSAKTDRDVRLADILFHGFHRMRVDGKHADVHLTDGAGIAYAAIDNDARPVVLDCESRELITEQCPTQAAASVNYKDAALSR